MTDGGPSRQTWKASWVTAAAPRRLAMTRVTLTGPTRFGAAAYGPSPAIRTAHPSERVAR